MPFAFDAIDPDRSGHFLRVPGRLRPEETIDDAAAELRAIADRLARVFPDTNEGWTVALLPLHEADGPGRRQAMAPPAPRGSGARPLDRPRHHLQPRAHESVEPRTGARSPALGASRQRLVRQLALEHLVLALAGALGGLALAIWAVSLSEWILPEAMTWTQGMAPVLVGLVFGLGGAVLLSKTLESFLFGVGRLAAVSFLGVPLTLVLAAAAANYFPARTAAAIDPIETIRLE